MGLYEQIAKKTTRYPDAGAVMEHVLKGKGKEIGFAPVTEILLHATSGLRLVGPLPAEVQNYTSLCRRHHDGARPLGPPRRSSSVTSARQRREGVRRGGHRIAQRGEPQRVNCSTSAVHPVDDVDRVRARRHRRRWSAARPCPAPARG